MRKNGLLFIILVNSYLDYDLIVNFIQRQGFEFESVHISDRGGFDSFIPSLEPDLIIADTNLPEFNALDALKITREKWKDLPFVIISGTLEEKSIVDLFNDNATDYILKGRPLRLNPALIRLLEDRLKKKVRDMKVSI